MVVVQPGDSLSLIADSIPDPAVTVSSIQAENGIGDANAIEPGQQLDVCVGNGIDDVTGASSEPAAVPADASGVEAQQRKLNELFAGRGIAELAVDGDSGPLTQQQLCAFRIADNLPISRADMEPGSEEERVLMSTTTLPIPPTVVVTEDRLIVIDKTCQVMFTGELNTRIVFVFGTSTGEPGYETDPQDAVRAFRYDPALENGGWHNSTTFPVAADNPLNGNMYRPVYFFRGEAIHGAQRATPAEEQGLRTAASREPGCVDRAGSASAMRPDRSGTVTGSTSRSGSRASSFPTRRSSDAVGSRRARDDERDVPPMRSIGDGPLYDLRERPPNVAARALPVDGRVIELAEYVPKMNVTPNAVATKDD